MPNYVYKCTSCSQTISIFHSFSEIVADCELCGVEASLQKDYSTPFNSTKAKKQTRRQVGQTTNDFIEQTKEDVKQEKENLKRESFND
jgi:putative FmdB family regulatory protein